METRLDCGRKNGGIARLKRAQAIRGTCARNIGIFLKNADTLRVQLSKKLNNPSNSPRFGFSGVMVAEGSWDQRRERGASVEADDEPMDKSW